MMKVVRKAAKIACMVEPTSEEKKANEVMESAMRIEADRNNSSELSAALEAAQKIAVEAAATAASATAAAEILSLIHI